MIKVVLVVVDDMEQLTGVLRELERAKLRSWGDITPSTVVTTPTSTPARLATLPSCDRSRPPYAFVIRDENGEILCDDC